jgi:uncharacterized protein (TIGR02453 family)
VATGTSTFTGFPAEAFAFYEGLRADNSRTYWMANRHTYEECVRGPLLALLAGLEPRYGEAHVFRPHRDVRFSGDKSPYKTHQGAFCQTHPGSGYYVHIDADGLFVAGGFHSHTREQTARYRRAVDDDVSGARLVEIMARLARHGFAADGDRVKTRPRGCPPDHPRLDLMRHESLAASRSHPAGPDIEGRAALDVVRADWKRLEPLVEWVTTHVGPA